MFINKFNQLIRNKWIWGIFAVLVCFLFVAPDIFRSGDMDRGAPDAIGTVGGKPVTAEQLRQAQLAARIDHFLRSNGYGPMLEGEALLRQAWRFVAAEQTAEKLGFATPRSQVKQFVARNFSDSSGAFNIGIAQERIRQLFGCELHEFERALGTIFLVRDVAGSHGLANWQSAPVVDALGHGETDKFTLRLASVSNEFASAEVETTDEKLKAFHERTLADYRIPDRVSVRYTIFRAADFMDKIDEISEDDARDMYDANPSSYTKVVDGVTTNLTFEAALPSIMATLRNEAAVDKATDEAFKLQESFSDRRRGYTAELLQPGFFEQACAAQGLSVSTTALFTASTPVVGIESVASQDFSEAAFSLDTNSTTRLVSDPIVGKANVYLLTFQESSPEHDPEFEEVRGAVTRAFIEDQRARDFADFVGAKQKAYMAAVDGGETNFEAAATAAGFTVGTNMVLSAIDANRVLPGDMRKWYGILPRLDVDSDSEIVFYGNGAGFVHVLAREPGDETLLQQVKLQKGRYMREMVGDALVNDWLEENLVSLNPSIPEAEADDEEEDFED